MTELKPCPFCGGNARMVFDFDLKIECTQCGATVYSCATIEEDPKRAVYDAWNRRTIKKG